jgi:plasmid maintenance system antidote protein VapI
MKLTGLKKFIDDNGTKQTWIAKKLNVDPSLVCLWVSGTRRIQVDELVALSKLLKRSTDYLLGLEK